MAASIEHLVALASFAHVVETRSFTAAAAALAISKSAVSARVARLENRLGVRLLHRTTRRVSPTDAGLALYVHAARMVAAAEEAAEVAEGASGEPRGLLRVSAPVTFSELYLAGPVAELLAAHPAMRVEIVTSDRLVDLIEEGFDVAVRIAALKDSSLVARKLATDRLVVVASPAYLARAGVPRTPADLVHHECLRSSHLGVGGEWSFREVSSGERLVGGGRFVASDAGVLREAAAAGVGLAVLPSSMIARDLAAKRLVALDGFPGRELGVYAVHPHRRHVPPKVRAFVDLLAARLASPPWRRAPPRPAGP